MKNLRSLARAYVVEGVLGLLVIVSMIEVIVRRSAADAPHSNLWFSIPALALLAVAIFARRRFPFGGAAAYWILAGIYSFIDWALIPFANSLFPTGLAVAFLLGNLRNAAKAGAGLALVWAGITTVMFKIPGHSTPQLIFVPMDFVIAWLAGFLMRGRLEQAEARAASAERARDDAARVAVAEERARIARELHDIVAHAVSVMVLQVGAVRHKLPKAQIEDRDALTGVEKAGRNALAEMRRLLAAMRLKDDDVEMSPQPGLDALESLMEDVGRAGLPVRLHVDGEPFPLPRAIDLSAYRIVQEGLTNALKHARANNADVTLRYRPDEIQLEVRDDGTGSAPSDGLGHGLVGIRERVKIYGGEMNVATKNGTGFVLTTRLPIGRDGR